MPRTILKGVILRKMAHKVTTIRLKILPHNTLALCNMAISIKISAVLSGAFVETTSNLREEVSVAVVTFRTCTGMPIAKIIQIEANIPKV